MNIEKLVRKNILKLIPYQSARRIGGDGDIWLNANESPNFDYFDLIDVSLNRYPEFQPKKLLDAYSSYVDVDVNTILITRGADEAIELLIKTFCNPLEDKIIFFPPTYDMYEISAKILGIESIGLPLLESFQLNIDLIVDNIFNVKLIYVCNPNNPTGNIVNAQDIIFLLELTLGKALIIIDEAYIEFCPIYSMVNLLKKYSNLVILRTLSKAFSLAGLRCGFILSNIKIIKVLSKVINPYPISIPVSEIASRALNKKNVDIMRKRVLDLNLNRIWLVQKLRLMKCVDTVFNSFSNYCLVRFFDSEIIFKELYSNKIIVRDQSKKINLHNCIRISIGSFFECQSVIRVIKKIDHIYKNFRG